MATAEELLEAKKWVKTNMIGSAGVVGCGIGMQLEGCVHVYVLDESVQIPDKYLNTKLVKIVTGEFKPYD